MAVDVRGAFITFEGSEGSGKSTQVKLLCRYLRAKRKKVLMIREPGGVVISEKIRQILLDVKNTGMNEICETLLYMAARAQLVHDVIVPALKKGVVVLCDRFLDSTMAYQGYGNGVNRDFIKTVGRFATQNISPDLTLIFDISIKEGLARRGKIRDRIERRALTYHNRVRNGYLDLARKEPARIKVIDGSVSKEVIQKIVKNHVNHLLKIL